MVIFLKSSKSLDPSWIDISKLFFFPAWFSCSFPTHMLGKFSHFFFPHIPSYCKIYNCRYFLLSSSYFWVHQIKLSQAPCWGNMYCKISVRHHSWPTEYPPARHGISLPLICPECSVIPHQSPHSQVSKSGDGWSGRKGELDSHCCFTLDLSVRQVKWRT